MVILDTISITLGTVNPLHFWGSLPSTLSHLDGSWSSQYLQRGICCVAACELSLPARILQTDQSPAAMLQAN